MAENRPEKVEEKKFVAKIESHGYECIKIATQGPFGRTGRNDRLVIASYGVSAFFEFKRDGEEAEKLQGYFHKKFTALGHKTYVVYRSEEAYRILMGLVEEAKARSIEEMEEERRTQAKAWPTGRIR